MANLIVGKRYTWEQIKKNTDKKWVLLAEIAKEDSSYEPKSGIFLCAYNDKSQA